MALIVQQPKLNPMIFNQDVGAGRMEEFWSGVAALFKQDVSGAPGMYAIKFGEFAENLSDATRGMRGCTAFDTNMMNVNYEPESTMDRLYLAARCFQKLQALDSSYFRGDVGLEFMMKTFAEQMIPNCWMTAIVSDLSRVLPASVPGSRTSEAQTHEIECKKDMSCFFAPGLFGTAQQTPALAIDYSDGRKPFANVGLYRAADQTIGLAANGALPNVRGRDVVAKKGKTGETFRCSQYTFYVGLTALLEADGKVNMEATAEELKKYVPLPDVYAELLAKQKECSSSSMSPTIYLPYDVVKIVSGHLQGLVGFSNVKNKSAHTLLKNMTEHHYARDAAAYYDKALEHFSETFEDVHDRAALTSVAEVTAPRTTVFVWDIATFERVIARASNTPTKIEVNVGGAIGFIKLNVRSYAQVNGGSRKTTGTVFVTATPVLSVFYAADKNSVTPEKVTPTFVCTALIKLDHDVKKGGKGSRGKGKAAEATAEDDVENSDGNVYYTFVTTCLDTHPQMYTPTFPQGVHDSAVVGAALANDVTVFSYLDSQTDKCNAYKTVLKDDGDIAETEVVTQGSIISMLTSIEYSFMMISIGKPHLANCRSSAHIEYVYRFYEANMKRTKEEPFSAKEFIAMYNKILINKIKEPTDVEESVHYHAVLRAMEIALVPLSEFIDRKVSTKNKSFDRLNALKPKTMPKSFAKKSKSAEENEDGEDAEQDLAEVDIKSMKRKQPATSSKKKGSVAKKSKADEEKDLAMRVLYGLGLMCAGETAALPSRATLSALTEGKYINEMPLLKWSEHETRGYTSALVSTAVTNEKYRVACPEGKIKKDGTMTTAWKTPLHTVSVIRSQLPILDAPIMSYCVRKGPSENIDARQLYSKMLQLLKDSTNEIARSMMQMKNVNAVLKAALVRQRPKYDKLICLHNAPWSSEHEESLLEAEMQRYSKNGERSETERKKTKVNKVVTFDGYTDEERAFLNGDDAFMDEINKEVDTPVPVPLAVSAPEKSKKHIICDDV